MSTLLFGALTRARLEAPANALAYNTRRATMDPGWRSRPIDEENSPQESTKIPLVQDAFLALVPTEAIVVYTFWSDQAADSPSEQELVTVFVAVVVLIAVLFVFGERKRDLLGVVRVGVSVVAFGLWTLVVAQHSALSPLVAGLPGAAGYAVLATAVALLVAASGALAAQADRAFQGKRPVTARVETGEFSPAGDAMEDAVGLRTAGPPPSTSGPWEPATKHQQATRIRATAADREPTAPFKAVRVGSTSEAVEAWSVAEPW